MRKVLGFVMLFVGLGGLLLSIVGVFVGLRLVDSMAVNLETNLDLLLQSLDTVEETMLLTKTTVGQANASLATVGETAVNVSQAIEDTQPLLRQATVVATENVPDSLEHVEAAIPALSDVAATIDSVLTTLSEFRIENALFGIDLGLGIEYDPPVPFQESVDNIGTSLEGVPESLRSLRGNLEVTEDNLMLISENVAELANNLDAVSESVAEIEPLIDDYIFLIGEIRVSTEAIEESISELVLQWKIVVTIVMIWFGLVQIAPLYLGFEILTGRREESTQ